MTASSSTLSSKRVAVLGAGAWGTALAIALAARHDVVLWGRNAAAMATISQARENAAYLPSHTFPDKLAVSADLAAALAHVNGVDGLLIAATSVSGLRSLTQQLQAQAIPNLVWLCKGLEEESGKLPHQVVREVLGTSLPVGVLSGPSFAQEVANGLPCALVIASTDAALREQVVATVHGAAIRVYSSEDVVGVEVGGAVKNILAIATGISDGLCLGLNARAALITRGLAEITRLGVALGARPETFMGLAGMGDLILTCTGDLSRNRRVGLGLAQGKPLALIVDELGHVAEGVRCAAAVRTLAQQLGVEMPIVDAVAAILFDGASAHARVTQLLSRNSRGESATA